MRALPSLLFAVQLLGPLPLGAADLVEPWAPGVSNIEVGVFGPFDGGARSHGILLGGGITERFSVGLFAAGARADDYSFGAVLFYTQPVGRIGEIDVWCETATLDSLDGASCGTEWSRAFTRVTPYARLSGEIGAGRETLTPLVGLVLPVGEVVELHFEASLEGEETDGRPLRLALGPNWLIVPRLEVLPELNWTCGPGGDERLDFSVTLVLDVAR